MIDITKFNQFRDPDVEKEFGPGVHAAGTFFCLCTGRVIIWSLTRSPARVEFFASGPDATPALDKEVHEFACRVGFNMMRPLEARTPNQRFLRAWEICDPARLQ